MTTFQLVSAMNTAFQNPKGNPLDIDWPRIQKQCLNIPDEVGELFKALGGHAKDSAADSFIKEAVATFKAALVQSLSMNDGFKVEVDVLGVRDALCDLPVFTGGAQHLMGVDGDRDMESVIDGVMSRFVKDDEDREATIAKHAANGITEVYFEGEYPNMVMKSAVDQPDAPKGKFLKSASFVEAVFYDLEAEDIDTNESHDPDCMSGCCEEEVEEDTCYDCDMHVDDCTCDEEGEDVTDTDEGSESKSAEQLDQEVADEERENGDKDW